MKKSVIFMSLIGLLSLTSCYDFARKQNELDAESNGRATLLEAESSKKAKIEETKANLESAKLEAEKRIIDAESKARASLVQAEAKAKSMKIISEAITDKYIQYQTVDAMYNHGNTIYVPTEAGLPILQRK